jgi:hypothetical protein
LGVVDPGQQANLLQCNAWGRENHGHLLIKGVLEKRPLLDGVSHEAIRELVTQSTVLRTKRGQVILQRGRGLYLAATRLPRRRIGCECRRTSPDTGSCSSRRAH